MHVLGMIKLKRNVYNSLIEPAYLDFPQDSSDFVHESPYEGIDLLLMSSIRSMPFPLGIHLLLGLDIHLNHLSGHNLNNHDPKSPSTGMIDLFMSPQIYKLLSQDAMKSLKVYNTELLNRFHKRKVHNTEVFQLNDFLSFQQHH